MWLQSEDVFVWQGLLVCVLMLSQHMWVYTHKQYLAKGACVNVVEPMWTAVRDRGRERKRESLQLYILWVGGLLHWPPTVQHFLMWRKVAIDLICLYMGACVFVCVGSNTKSTSEGWCMMFRKDSTAERCDGWLCENLMSVLTVCLTDNRDLPTQTKPTWQDGSY